MTPTRRYIWDAMPDPVLNVKDNSNTQPHIHPPLRSRLGTSAHAAIRAWRERCSCAVARTALSCRRADDGWLPACRDYRFPRPNMRPKRSAIDLAGLISITLDPSGGRSAAACSAESVVRTWVV